MFGCSVSARKKNRFAPKKIYIIHMTFVWAGGRFYGSNNISLLLSLSTHNPFSMGVWEKKDTEHVKMAAQVDFYLIKVYLDTAVHTYQ